MDLRAEDLVDSTCYSDLQSTSLGNSPIVYTLPSLPSHFSPTIPSRYIPMPSDNPQRSQAQNSTTAHLSSHLNYMPMSSNNRPRSQSQVQAQAQNSASQHPAWPGVRLSEPRQHTAAPTQLPFYLPPSQPLPTISSMFSDNQLPGRIYEPASNNANGYQGYQGYYHIQGIVPPPPFPQYQPQLYLPYRPHPEYNVTGVPFIPIQPNIFPPPIVNPAPPYPASTPYFANTVSNVQQPVQNRHATKIPIARPEKHISGNGGHGLQAEPAAVDNVDNDDDFEPSTPILQRISSGRFHDDERRMYAKELTPLLKQELESDISQSSNLANAIFPTDRLPFPVDDDLLLHLADNNIWSIEGAHFIQKPESYNEVDLAKWLNILGRAIGMAANKKRVRIWSAITHDLPPIGSNTIRKPDIILLDRDDFIHARDDSNSSRIHWSSIRAFGEVTAQESFPTRMTDTVNEKSYLLFLTQDNRRFVPALRFDGGDNFSLTVTDRQGQIRMPAMSLSVSGKNCALVLLRILAVLMYGSLSDVGLDPSMVCDKKGVVSSIFVNGKEFTVFRRIYALQALVGRGTKVWIVTREGQYYILKDSWIQSGRVESEIKFLELMARHPAFSGRVPKLIEGEDLQIGKYADSTEWYRIDIGQVDRHRIHRRHVTEPIGSPLIKFKSKVECLSAIVDVLDGMYVFKETFHAFTNNVLTVLDYLFLKLRILHRDISPNNILLVRDDNGVHCLLIDFDYAVTLKAPSESKQKASHGSRDKAINKTKASHGFRTVSISPYLLSSFLTSCFLISRGLRHSWLLKSC